MTTTGTKTYRASCRCGAIRYEVDMDLSQGTTQCNCTYCSKVGWWGYVARPSAFRLLAGADHLLEFTTTPGSVRRRCRTCGLEAFGHGDIPELGGEFYAVNIRCLDDVDLEGVPVRYLDGKHNTWAELAVKPYVNPFVGAGAPGLKPIWQT